MERRRLEGDGGAVLVEFALVAPFIVAVALGIMEFGIAWRDANVLERSVAASSRTGASWGTDGWADYWILQAVKGSMSSATSLEIEKVVVFNARTTSTVPADCTALSGPNGLNSGGTQCNVYSGTQVASDNPRAHFGDWGAGKPCGGADWDHWWCPASRDRNRSGGTDYIGVWVSARYTPVTGLLPSDATFERTTIFQLEPEVLFG